MRDSLEGALNGEGVTRRQALSAAAKLGVLVAGAGTLAGCGSGSSSTSGATGATTAAGVPGVLAALPGGTPVRGGTFTMGVIGIGQAENLFPGTAGGDPDAARDYLLYNLLFYPGSKMSPIVPGLALSAEPNTDATVWTIKLRDGVTWHNGKPFTADDVVYNFRALWSDPSQNYSAAILQPLINFSSVRKRDNLTVEVPLKIPVAEFPGIFSGFNFGILPNGATKKSTATNPVGTGPFKFHSFTPGSQSVFRANTDYWETGKPYVSTVVINSSFRDNIALLNALESGSVNLARSISFTQGRQVAASQQAQILSSPLPATTYTFGMRVDKGPYADNRVRQAFKLLANRQEYLTGVFSGFGTVGNDLIGVGSTHFASDLKPTYDPDKAKSLFKAAGVLGESFSVPTADVLPGYVEAATIFAEQATAAGIKMTVDRVDPSSYFLPPPAGSAYTRPLGMNSWYPTPCLTLAYLGALTPNAPYQDTHWGSQPNGGAAATKLIYQAIAATDSGKAADLWNEVQKQQVTEGGFLAYTNAPFVDAAATSVRGLSASSGFPFNNYRLQDGWIQG